MNTDIFSTYPALDEKEIDSLLKAEIAGNSTKLIVLDDDPTGVQTVHDVTVCTHWEKENIRHAFQDQSKLFFIMTNSRAMTEAETTRIHKEIVHNVASVAREFGIRYLYMSRGDSTLRGHYPLETLLLKQGLEEVEGCCVDGEVLCPFFLEGGRFTIDNVHYVRYGETLVPAAETEFAKDKTFGYKHACLPEYVEEKTAGAYPKESVTCISLSEIRAMDIEGITDKLCGVKGFGKICVNAIDYCDIKVFSIALYRAMARGKTFLFRTAASLVKVMGGVDDKPLLTRKDMITKETPHGGLIIVGSHTKKTTAQLEALLKNEKIVAIPFNSDLILQGDEAFQAEIDRCLALETEAICAGRTAVCYTSRKLLSLEGDTKEAALLRSVKISDGVQSLVSRLNVEPAFVIAKGGITSSDIGVKALRIEYARVMGQVIPGIPVWQADDNSKFPKIPYVIFPGNVGEDETLREVAEVLMQA